MAALFAETYLWRAVVDQAFHDAIGASSIGLTPNAAAQLRQSSRDWILGNQPEFRSVCDFAEIDPDWLIRRFQQVELGRTRFMRAAAAVKEIAG